VPSPGARVVKKGQHLADLFGGDAGAVVANADEHRAGRVAVGVPSTWPGIPTSRAQGGRRPVARSGGPRPPMSMCSGLAAGIERVLDQVDEHLLHALRVQAQQEFARAPRRRNRVFRRQVRAQQAERLFPAPR